MTGPAAQMPGRGLFAVLLPTLDCNLSCGYCFEPHPRRRWTSAEADHALGALVALAAAEGAAELRLHWQGGEILGMGRAFLSGALARAEEEAWRAGIRLDQRLQTNLTLFGPWVAALARRHLGGRIGTSWDGSGERADAREGSRGFERRFWRAFAEAAEAGLEIGVLAVVRPALLDEGAPAWLERVRARGIRRLRLTLPFEAAPGRGDWLDPVRAGRFLAEAYRTWAGRGRDAWLELRPFAWLERRLAGEEPREPGLCVFSESCAEAGLSVGPDGGTWLCDSCVGRAGGYGNVFERDLVALWHGPERRAALRACAALLVERCLACRWAPICQGGCLVRARSVAGGAASDHYCDSYRALFGAIESAAAARRPAQARPPSRS